ATLECVLLNGIECPARWLALDIAGADRFRALETVYDLNLMRHGRGDILSFDWGADPGRQDLLRILVTDPDCSLKEASIEIRDGRSHTLVSSAFPFRECRGKYEWPRPVAPDAYGLYFVEVRVGSRDEVRPVIVRPNRAK